MKREQELISLRGEKPASSWRDGVEPDFYQPWQRYPDLVRTRVLYLAAYLAAEERGEERKRTANPVAIRR